MKVLQLCKSTAFNSSECLLFYFYYVVHTVLFYTQRPREMKCAVINNHHCLYDSLYIALCVYSISNSSYNS